MSISAVLRTLFRRDAPSNRFAVSAYDWHLAVVVGRGGGTALETLEPVIYGTAFPIAAGWFAPAAHVVANFEAMRKKFGDDIVLGLAHQRKSGDIDVGQVTRFEMKAGIDLALLRCRNFEGLAPVPMAFTALTFLEPATAFGYPHAIDTERLAIIPRAFAGYVMTRREIYKLPAQPPGYELTFPCPEGLSGAPLLVPSDTGPRCHGFVIGSWTYANKQFRAGLAVASDALLSIDSELLGAPLAQLFGQAARPLGPPTAVRNPNMTGPDPTTLGWPDDEIDDQPPPTSNPGQD